MQKFLTFVIGATALATGLATVTSSAQAQAQERQSATYSASLLGLPIGTSTFETVIDGDRFEVAGTLASAGVGSLFSSVNGTSGVSGTITERGVSGERYRLDYAVDDKRWTSDVEMRDGRVASSKVAPKRTKTDKSFVPVTDAHLASVVDPLSGLMIRASSPKDVCNRTLPFYDGWSRLDLTLSPAGTENVSIDGYQGTAVACTVRIRPVGGFDRDSKGLGYLSERQIEARFAPVARDDIYVPVYIDIPTQVGALVLRMTSVR